MIVALAAVTVGLAIAVLAVTAGFVVLVVCILQAIDAGAGPEDSSDADSGSDGGQRRYDPPAPPSGGGGDAAWWPQFERDLARYVADRTAGCAPVTIEAA